MKATALCLMTRRVEHAGMDVQDVDHAFGALGLHRIAIQKEPGGMVGERIRMPVEESEVSRPGIRFELRSIF